MKPLIEMYALYQTVNTCQIKILMCYRLIRFSLIFIIQPAANVFLDHWHQFIICNLFKTDIRNSNYIVITTSTVSFHLEMKINSILAEFYTFKVFAAVASSDRVRPLHYWVKQEFVAVSLASLCPKPCAVWSWVSGEARTRGPWQSVGFLPASLCRHSLPPTLPLSFPAAPGPTLRLAPLTSQARWRAACSTRVMETPSLSVAGGCPRAWRSENSHSLVPIRLTWHFGFNLEMFST